jgi:hypothetical protein
MKRAFLLIVGAALLVALGFAQTPAASINTDQTIKGCLAGSDGNYRVVEDNTDHIFKIITNSVDFKQHLGHDVALIGHRTSGASSAAADNSFAVTELNMISEHCAAAAASTATVGAPTETSVTPDAADAPGATPSTTVTETATTPAPATSPTATVSAPAGTAVTPAVDAVAPMATTVTPARDAASPAAAVGAPWDTASTPTADASDRTRLPATSRRLSATSATGVTTPAVVTASTSSETASTPDASTATPIAPAGRGALWLLISVALLVIAFGTLVPFLSRWRKRKMLERTGAPNLSLTREVSSNQGKSDPQEPRKAA